MPRTATGQFLRATRFSDKINWADGYDVEGRSLNQIALPEQGGETVEVCPSVFGGVNMYPAAYNPDSGMMYGYEGRKRCRGTELNRRHEDFQSSALPTELPRHGMASL